MKLKDMTYYDFVPLDLCMFIPGNGRVIERISPPGEFAPVTIIEFDPDDKFPEISREYPGRITVHTKIYGKEVYWMAVIAYGPFIGDQLRMITLGTGKVEM